MIGGKFATEPTAQHLLSSSVLLINYFYVYLSEFKFKSEESSISKQINDRITRLSIAIEDYG